MPTPPATRGTRDGTSGPAWLHRGNCRPSRLRQSSSRPSHPASSKADTDLRRKSLVWQDSNMSPAPDADSPRTSSSRSPCPAGASRGVWAHQRSRTHSLSRTSQPQRTAPTHHHQRKTTGQNTSTTASSSPSSAAGGCFASRWQRLSSHTFGSRPPPLAGWRSSRFLATKQTQLVCVVRGRIRAHVPTTWLPSVHTTP